VDGLSLNTTGSILLLIHTFTLFCVLRLPETKDSSLDGTGAHHNEAHDKNNEGNQFVYDDDYEENDSNIVEIS